MENSSKIKLYVSVSVGVASLLLLSYLTYRHFSSSVKVIRKVDIEGNFFTTIHIRFEEYKERVST